MSFKERLKSLREKNGITPSRLGADMGKSEGAVRNWEAGRSYPDVDLIIKLTEYFNVSADYLLGLTDYKNPAEHEKAVENQTALEEEIKTLKKGPDKDALLNFLTDTLKSINESAVFPSPAHFAYLIDYFNRVQECIEVLRKEANEQAYVNYTVAVMNLTEVSQFLPASLLANVKHRLENDVNEGLEGSKVKLKLFNELTMNNYKFQSLLENKKWPRSL
jgi:transcriptional regulator with XRE-family HTH domain